MYYKQARRPSLARTRNYVDELRGVSQLAIAATRGVTDLVEAMHHTIGGGPELLGQPLAGATRLLTAPVYGAIRGVTRLVGAGLDVALGQLATLVGDGTPVAERESIVAVVNGVLGDYLAESGNPLAIPMELRQAGQALPLERQALAARLPAASGKILVLVHGSCMDDRSWLGRDQDYGARLARELGWTPLYLRYNSGLHISTNGRAFADRLEALVGAWPVAVEELAIVGHSMGGLVARGACHAGEVAGQAWRRALGRLVCVGSPHHGAVLERGGNLFEQLLGVSRYSAPLARLGRIRSAGVTDLRFGSVLDEDWHGRDRFAHGADPRRPLPLPAGVDCFAVAGSTAPSPCARPPGDGLVSVNSALGRHRVPARALGFAESHQWVAWGVGHVELLGRLEVYAKLREWLSRSASADLHPTVRTTTGRTA